MLLEEESLLKKDARPSQGRVQAYGEELAGREQNTTSGHVLGGELGAGKSHTEKPDKDPSAPHPRASLLFSQAPNRGSAEPSWIQVLLNFFFFFPKQQPILEDEEDGDPLEF